jgi:hemerythrin
MPLVDVNSIPQVALAFQNEDHAVEGNLLNAVAEAIESYREGTEGQEAVLAPLEALVEHMREHFERENRAMREHGFPAYAVHRAEHSRVLSELEREAFAFRAQGDSDRLGRYVTSVVPSWFVNHIQTMDAVTAHFIQRSSGDDARGPPL